LLQDEFLICAVTYHRRHPLHPFHLHQRETYKKQLPAMAGAGAARRSRSPEEFLLVTNDDKTTTK
jgi:hypothetical protein